ncbi:ABC-type nitrate/sulfonate/bicarbonate transport system, substrate-binding protein [Peptoniphilus asaccharolyticus DSM 20463]|uniref:ABC-type nitrate/sulfonate/bicarbonate transport system, substrate-binding protein n=1 Tax=Peptoniphilus asaccharolyticus DSM 20463 TaxID=573058 RepID=A0A1W1VDZ6_PEPAS|nr:ABC transporter substrate-binding protein [Peptoniphilus asaccharolyticus]MBL7574559.1 ABC transporter substrate-binding protein [Peptoniphilus asaccharolyticus]SMB91420.1 ABC-type nitrate/sulfonate/bicarbonate transport system, substrate-binding protein [Peptoniphilus asaccharolyticus DSM 20463]
MKKIIGLILIGMMLLVGCGEKQESKDGTKELTLVLDYTPNTNHTGIYVAKELGYFAEEGIELNIVQPPQDGAPVLVASGKAQVGIDYQDTIAAAYAQDEPLPVTNIAALVQHNTSGIVSLKGNGMDRPKGMEGKKYATWGMEVEQAMIKNVVEKDGGDFSKVQLVPSNYSDIFTGLGNDIDAVWIFYGWDGIAAQVKNVAVDYFAFKDINPVFDYYTPTIIANNEFLKEDPETAKAFLRALKKGYEYSIENPKEAAEILLKDNPELDSALVMASQEYLKDEYISEAKRWGEFDSTRWNNFYAWLFENGLIEKEIPADFGFSNEYLPE